MEAMKKAASGAVERVRNSPLFRRKFGTARSDSPLSDGESSSATTQQELHPERDLTPFVQGVYFNVSVVYPHRIHTQNTIYHDLVCHCHRWIISVNSRWPARILKSTGVRKNRYVYCGAPPPAKAAHPHQANLSLSSLRRPASGSRS